MRVTVLWIVRDVTSATSELADICFSTTPEGFADYRLGWESMKPGSYAAHRHTVYAGPEAQAEAMEDALGRLQRVEAAVHP